MERFGSGHPFTAMVPNLKDIDPDDAFSSIPYEKGFLLLFYLETLVGSSKGMVYVVEAEAKECHWLLGCNVQKWRAFFVRTWKSSNTRTFQPWNGKATFFNISRVR